MKLISFVRLAALGIGAGLVALPAAAQQGEPPPPQVVTIGQAVIERAPDRAFITVTAEARARNPADAQRQAAAAMSSVRDRLQGLQVPKDAVRTLAYSVEPEYDFANGRRTLRDYVARNTIELRVDQVERVGEVLDAVVAAGATSVGDVRFDLKDRDAVEREALRLAVADARARAEAAAAGAGRAIAAVVRIQEEGRVTPPPRPVQMAMRAEAMQSPETPIAPGQIEIRARVTLTATLK